MHRLRGDLDEEWRVLREAHELDSGHRDVRIRIAKVLVDRGRLDEAIAMFEDLAGDGPDYVPFLLGVALAKRGKSGDVERAAELFEQTAALADATEPALRLDGAEAFVKVCRKLKQWDRALAACRTFAGVLGAFRAKHLEASIHLERGDSASAQRVLLEAAALELTPTQRETIGVLFVHAGDNDHAIELLEPVAPRTEWTESTAALITAAQATERDELTIRVCRQLRAAGVARNSIADAEAAALHRRGELGAAIEVVEEFLSSREDPFLRLRLSTLGIAAQRPELIERDPARLPQPHDGDPHVAVVAVGVLRAAGVHDAAIRYAYDAYRAHRSSPEGWAAILEAFNPVSGPKNHVQPEVVSPDAAVLFREGQNRRWIIVEPREPKAEYDEFSPDTPLVVAMLGKRVGESFELRRETALPRTYVIEEILSKYVRAYHRCLEQWEEQFPDVPGPIMIEIPENLADDIEGFTRQLMPLLEKRARQVTELERLYETKPLTLHMLARGLGGSVFGAMSHLITATKLDVRCTRVGMEEAREVLTALDGGQRVILETSALSTLFLLRETELFGALRGRIAIAQATLDELRVYRREVERSGDGSLGVHDGRLTMIEYDQESRAKHLGVVDALLESATEWEVFHEKERDRFTPDEWDRLVNIGGSGAVESLHRAMRTGEPVWCDDMMLALVANERGVRVAWTQLMCHYLLLHSEIRTEQAHRISAKLVGCRFVKTNTTPGIYLEAARLAKWNPDHWPLHQHLRLFEVGGWAEHATGLLAVNVLREWWRHAPSDAAANAATVALLDRIAARSNGNALISAIRGVLERAFGVDVLGYQRARSVFDSWARARPFRQGVLG